MLNAIKVLYSSLLNGRAFEEKKIIIPNTCTNLLLEPISYLATTPLKVSGFMVSQIANSDFILIVLKSGQSLSHRNEPPVTSYLFVSRKSRNASRF